MKTNKPFTLRDDCVQYRIVEQESIESITRWALLHTGIGADLWFDFPDNRVWVIVPESQLYYFLDHFGNAVSAI